MPAANRTILRTVLISSAFAMTTALGAGPAAAAPSLVSVKGPMRDYNTAAAGPFDHAVARAKITAHKGRSTVTFRVAGISRSAAGQEFGAHLHVGPCVTDNGAAALAHYNTDVLAGRTPPRVDPTTEVWLDFTVSRSGKAKATARVPFVPEGGDRSIVIHEHETKADGTAGARLACLPVVW